MSLRDAQKQLRESRATRQVIQNWDIICPCCGTVVHQTVTFTYKMGTLSEDFANQPEPSLHLHCPSCKTDFLWRRVSIRAKTSRGSKRQNTREFSVRVLEHNGKDYRNEGLIQFTSNGYSDFELRSGDQAAFCYIAGSLAQVQNLTVGKALALGSGQQFPAPKITGEVVVIDDPEKRNCYVATYVYGRDSVEVALLRQFRDDVLLKYTMLAGMVKLYYLISPHLVSKFGSSRVFQCVVKTALNPVVRCIAAYHRRKCLACQQQL